jgi:AAA+ superfamily predicted ATPase
MNEQNGGSAAVCYQDFLDHLFDEFRIITCQILRFTKRWQKAGQVQDNSTRGLFVEEGEVFSALQSLIGIEAGVAGDPEIVDLDRMIQSKRQDISARLAATGPEATHFPLLRVARIFGLTPPEVDLLVMAMATEVDRRYERIFAFLNDDLTRKAPTIGLALELLQDDLRPRILGWQMFSHAAPLVAYSLIQIHDGAREGISQKSTFAIDERIRRYLLGDTGLSQLQSVGLNINYPSNEGTEKAEGHETREKMLGIIQATAGEARRRLIFWLYGKSEEEKFRSAMSISQQVGLPLISADLEEILAEPDHSLAIRNVFREAALQSGFMFLWKGDCLYRDSERAESLRRALFRVMETLSWVTFFSAETLWIPEGAEQLCRWYPFALDFPSYMERRKIWSEELSGSSLSPLDIDTLASRFTFEAGKIRDVIAYAKALANGDGITADDIYCACRAQSGQRLSAFAKRVTPRFKLEDIVLPEDSRNQLKEICRHIRHRHTVYFTWGFEKRLALGKGLNILFSGLSGTGKTMAANIIANEFNLTMYQIDLSSVVSKYIGETEKNLNRIFREVASGDVILFFDEADALFGKRSEVKDAHDRYANIEINYLLQKMEDHEGIVILATNLSKNLDEAFLRRLHYSVEFPFPVEKHRLLIWQRIFPDETPLDPDIDFSFLAERFKLSGGNIKNVAVTAAFYAAEDETPVAIHHIILAVKREMQKMGRLCVKGDFGKYFELVEGEGT